MTGEPMQCLIDWYSFTVPLVGSPEAYDTAILKLVLACLEEYGLKPFLDVLWTGDLEIFEAKGFYTVRAMDRTTKLSLSFGGVNSHVLVDCTGETCQVLRDFSLLSSLLTITRTRCSRIDVTADILAPTTPEDFVSSHSNLQITSTSDIRSDTGETSYLGSWKSDRFARVYRYSGNHPRARFLRVEHVHRGKWAKAAAELACHESVDKLLNDASEHYGWTHPIWTPKNAEPSKLRAKKHDRDGAATLKWLDQAVAPAIVRAHREGLINAVDWFRRVTEPLGDLAYLWSIPRNEKADAVGVGSEMLDMHPVDDLDIMAVDEPQVDVDHAEPRRP